MIAKNKLEAVYPWRGQAVTAMTTVTVDVVAISIVKRTYTRSTSCLLFRSVLLLMEIGNLIDGIKPTVRPCLLMVSTEEEMVRDGFFMSGEAAGTLHQTAIKVAIWS